MHCADNLDWIDIFRKIAFLPLFIKLIILYYNIGLILPEYCSILHVDCYSLTLSSFIAFVDV